MQLRRLGNSGLKVSVIGLGCNNFGMRIDQAQTRMVVDAALDCGVNFFDTADIYGASKSEVFLGEALKGRRDKAVLATKFANPMGEGEYLRGGARRYIVKAVEDSLRRLHTDHIDLYQMHVPDPDTPIEVLWLPERVGVLAADTPVPDLGADWDLRTSTDWTPDSLIEALRGKEP